MTRRLATWLPRVALAAMLLAGACAPSGPALESATVSTATLTPSTTDRAELAYRLARPASVSLAIALPDGTSVSLLDDEPRPSAGSYVHVIDGTIPQQEQPGARRVLPDGRYGLTLTAKDSVGRVETATFQLVIADADTQAPVLENLAAYPPVLTPNFDGVDDVAAITYRLTERARVFAFATDQGGQRVYVGTQELLEPGEYRELWDGTQKERPLPDGAYRFWIRATDLAGNSVLADVPIQVAASGRPDARILKLTFSPRRLMLGDELQVEAVIRNVGTVALRTQGPPPGHRYSTFDSFSALTETAPGDPSRSPAGERPYIDRLGTWRLGVDWAGSPTASGSKYPYRWGLGRDLAPGEEATIVGRIAVDHGPNLDRMIGVPTNRFFFYGGLIHEGIAFQDDRIGGAWIEVGY